jgi:hypothetical protein
VPLEFRDARLDNYREQTGNKSALKAAQRVPRRRRRPGAHRPGRLRQDAPGLLDPERAPPDDARRAVHPRAEAPARPAAALRRIEDRRGPAEERAFIERLFSASLLVLDDLGVEKGSEYTNRTLYTLYEERCDRGLRTIWTTNLSFVPEGTGTARSAHTRPPTIGEQLGDDRLPSRLAGRSTVAYLSTRDQRLPFKGGRDVD